MISRQLVVKLDEAIGGATGACWPSDHVATHAVRYT